MTGLFRRQAIDSHTNKLHGEVLLLPRLSHSLVLIALLLWLAATLAWLTTSTYTRKETVVGWLEADAGVVRVYARNGGNIGQVLVSEGEHVARDQPLLVVQSENSLADGRNLGSIVLDEYASQRRLLEDQLARVDSVHARKMADVQQRMASLSGNIQLLGDQQEILLLRQRLAGEKHRRFTRLAQSGHISRAELDLAAAEDLALQEEQQNLKRNRLSLQNQLQQLEYQRQLLPEEAAREAGNLQAQLSSLEQQVAQLEGERAYVVKAPRSGAVSNLQARSGQATKAGLPLLSLVPLNAQLKAHLLVPVHAAGFLQPGQLLNIRYDAFPYQKFGLYPGRIQELSDSVLLPGELDSVPVSTREPAYRVTAIPDQPSVQAYGKHFALKSGMTLSADIELSERSILQWLLEPLYSLRGRL
ncbi:HlyD family secretion protein [Haliea sp. E17]|uniref:HlyD family secretion protein n=1 Tax=Haliea sp. E17 TaxID=3401576 RepID=UPI003AAACB46